MSTTYSTSLKLALIGNGEQSGIWGTTTNTNLGTLLEQAIAGVQTITMSNADYTLSSLNGVADEARNAVLVVQGANSAVRKIVAPLVEKFYTVSNQTSGGYAVTIGGSTGLTVSIPNGFTGQVYCDGSNFYSAMTSSAGNYNVTGDLVVAGSITAQGTSNIVPAGSLLMWSTGSAPAGYLLCNGDAVSRSTYATLFSVVGTTFGAGNGSTTFNLPNYTNRMPYGTTVGATGGSADAIVVSHTHTGTTSTVDINHTHSGQTAGQSNGHTHQANSGLPGTGQGAPGGNTVQQSAGSATTSDVSADHSHSFTSGAMNSNNTHNHTFTTASSGGSGTNANLPPYLGINFIIKT